LEYLPKSRYIMGATKMVNPGESDAIKIKVPDVPGDYPFICTFPGHWRIMQGILKVSPRGSYAAVNPNAKKIAIMGGGGSHNFLKFFGVADGKVLNQQGKNEVNYTEKSSELTTLLKDTDILMLTNNREMEDATKEAIFSRVNQGMPMLIVHPSVWYNWKDWPEYNKELVAGGSTSHEKLQEFEVIVTKPNHPIMKGVPTKFKIVDELYRWKYDPTGPKIEVLAIGKGMESGEEFPVVWIVKHRIANIVGNTLGHDERAHSLPAYQSILENSLEWAMPK
jgi:type 1 glutamine amidotransferase